MKNFLTVALVFVTATGCSCFKNAFAKSHLKTVSDNVLYSIVVMAVSALVLAFFGGIRPVSPMTMALSVVFGILVAAEQIVGNEALKRGPMSLTNLVADGGLILTVIFACTVCGEKLTAIRAVGIVLMLLSMGLICNPKADKKVTTVWVALAAALFVLCGVLGIIQKMLAMSGHSDEIYGFLFYNFLVGVAVTAVYLLFLVKVQRTPVTVDLSDLGNHVTGSALLSGLCNAGLHISTMLAVDALPATVAFPIVDGGKLFFLTLADVLFFHQKLTRIQRLGIVLAGVAIVILA